VLERKSKIVGGVKLVGGLKEKLIDLPLEKICVLCMENSDFGLDLRFIIHAMFLIQLMIRKPNC
jgi:hypothetical protein